MSSIAGNAITSRSETAAAAHLRAYMEFTVGDHEEAARALAEAIAIEPTNDNFHFDLGIVHAAAGHMERSKQSFDDVIRVAPRRGDAIFNMALIEHACGNWRHALQCYRRALALDWTLFFGMCRAVFSKRARQNLTTRRTWAIPTRDLPEIHDLISLGFLKRGELAKAEAAALRAIAGEPTGTRYGALGNILQRMGQLPAAKAAMEKALELDPGLELARHHLAMIAFHLYEYDSARSIYEELIRKNPTDVFTLSRLLVIDTLEGRLDDARSRFSEMVRLSARNSFQSLDWEALCTIAYRAIMWPLPRPIHQTLMRVLNDGVERTAVARGGPYSKRPRSRPGRLRVGYLSAHFTNHPIGHVTADLFRHHDRSKFEIHVILAAPRKTNAYTQAIAAGAENFHEFPGKISETAKAIADLDLDILVYLDGYMEHRLMQVVAMRPAPVQVYWLGHAGLFEISAVDYIIADETVLPKAETSPTQAQVVRLPDVYHCASSHPISATPSRVESGLPASGFVFAGFNNPEKIDRTIFNSWIRILSAVPDSVLWLSLGPTARFRSNLRTEAENAGVSGERLIFADRTPDKADHLARHRLAGILLDTVTLNASTTALDALWAGVPVLTIHGDRFASRIATSMLKAIGLEEMICKTMQEYEARAIHFATTPSALDSIREKLAANRESFPLFNAAHFCRNLEAALDCIQVTAERSRAVDARSPARAS